MTLTVIDAAQDALLALIVAQPEFADLVDQRRVSLGYPVNGPDQIWNTEVDYVWIDEKVPDWEASSPDMPDSTHAESFTLTVKIVTAAPGDASFTAARDSAFAFARAISTAMAADWTLGGVVVNSYPAGGQLDGGKVDSGRAAELSMAIRVSAYPAE